MQPAENIIPENREGSETNNESVAELKDEKEALAFFKTIKQRLMDVNNWHQVSGTGTADFQLTDGHGDPVRRPPQKGDHFRIDIPGPGSITGEGHDWVRVEAIEETADSLAIRVRPASNPENERSDIAHFFGEEATSSFVVKRSGNRVIAGVYGRNEQPNTDTETLVDKVRNTAVAAGAISAFSKFQWKRLVTGLVKKTDKH